MNQLQYTTLLNFIFANQSHIDIIKSQYYELLSRLTIAPELSNELFINKIMEISNMGEIVICYYIDTESKRIYIVGTGTIIFEPKLIRDGKYVGHIEDIVVHESHRKLGISQEILKELERLAENKNCYKVILDCMSVVQPVYEKNGFCRKGIQMVKYKGT